MGLKDFFKRRTSSDDGRANEDYEARKDDAFIASTFAGGEAMEAAADEEREDEED